MQKVNIVVDLHRTDYISAALSYFMLLLSHYDVMGANPVHCLPPPD